MTAVFLKPPPPRGPRSRPPEEKAARTRSRQKPARGHGLRCPGAHRVSRGHRSEGSSSFPELSWRQAPGHRAGIKGRGRLSPALGTQEDARPQEQPEQPGRTAE